MVISEKFVQTRMNGSTVGFGGEYDIPDVPHAMRLTSSGTFIHGNYWYTEGQPALRPLGHQPRLRRPRGRPGRAGRHVAKWFFDNSLVGDVVTVKHSPDKTVAPDNGLNGWNMSWSAVDGGQRRLTRCFGSTDRAARELPRGPAFPSVRFLGSRT